MNPNVDVLVAISFSGIAACRPTSGTYQSKGRQPRNKITMSKPKRAWNKHPVPNAATSGKTARSATDERSVRRVINPYPTVISAKPNHMNGR